MTEEENILLKAVLDDPDNDAPRLRYADWCEQQSDEPTKARAEFILLQIEIAQMSSSVVDRGGAYHQMYRAMKLQDEYKTVWTSFFGAIIFSCEFNRGFVELVSLMARDFLDNAPQLFDLAPIYHLDLTNVITDAEEFFASTHLGRMRSLRMDNCNLEDRHLQLLAASPYVAELRWLSVRENRIGMPGIEALATSPNLKQLVYSDFSGNPVDPCEELGIDGEVVVTSWLPEAGQILESRHGTIPWLYRGGETISECHPSRFGL
jgi:uncharacterized protein (TIGR02996 family)